MTKLSSLTVQHKKIARPLYLVDMLDAAMLDKIGGLAEGARTELADEVLLSCVDPAVFHKRVGPPEPLRTAVAAVALLALVQGAYVQA
jgi:hypothetical protein